MRRRIRSAALPLHRHSLPQLAVDGVLVALAYYLAFQLRFDSGPPVRYAHLREATIWWVLLGSLPVLVLSRVYQRRWRYAGQRDYEAVVRAIVVIVLLSVVAIEVLRPVYRYPDGSAVAVVLPNGVIVLFALLSLVFLVGVRALARSVYERRPLAFRGRKGQRTILIAGAGEGGRMVAREIMRNRELGLMPVGFLDDDPHKLRLRVDGLRVRGNTEGDLPRVLDEAEPDEVIIAIPSAPGSTRARIVRECRVRGIPVRTLPTVFELLQTRGTLARQMREVRVEDVLGREPVRMELERVGAYLAGEIVLVTGAGGSIGSELCRQIARVEPHRIVLLDHAEDNLFAILRELEEERHVPPSMLAAVLADCKEEERMREVFAEHRPSVVFHAAAYKHVGLMEANPVEAVRNNAVGTRVVAHVAGGAGVGRRNRGVQGARRVRTRRRQRPLPGHALRGRALRQRARLLRQRRADLPPPDRAGRSRDRDRRTDDPLLHDHSRGRPADHPLRVARRRRGRPWGSRREPRRAWPDSARAPDGLCGVRARHG
jgi:FlaA1/EpsC-like NDP-sugar epimerase